MGDGQHAWAAAEWIVLLRNSFVREEAGGLVLAAGMSTQWQEGGRWRFGPTPTSWGPITVTVEPVASELVASEAVASEAVANEAVANEAVANELVVNDPAEGRAMRVSWYGEWRREVPAIFVQPPGREAQRVQAVGCRGSLVIAAVDSGRSQEVSH